MSEFEWIIPPEAQPQPDDYDFDLTTAMAAMVGIRTVIPADAFTADVLGTERTGNGIVLADRGLVLTIGYLITEASEIWLTFANGQTVAGHPLGYDQETGFGLIQPLARIDQPGLLLGESASIRPGTDTVTAGAGGQPHALASHVVARQEFAGYWEYVLDEAIFAAPAHPYWGGTGLLGPDGTLIGVGSLQLEQAAGDDESIPLNMFVPIDLLKPILDDMVTMGQANRPPRPWLGIYASEADDRVVILGVADHGPSASTLKEKDVVLTVGGAKVTGLANLFRQIWSLGQAGVEVPITVQRDGRPVDLTVMSGDRNRYLKGPSLH